MLKKISFSWIELLKQIKNDLWCKEVETGYTVSYTWAANQLGHFAIGFVPSILIMMVLLNNFGAHIWLMVAALVPMAFMLIKEYGDVQAEIALSNKNPSVFPLAINDIWLNAANACWFSLVGSIVAALCVFNNLCFGLIPVMGLLLLCIPTAFIMKYWISHKKCFQQSGLPYITRLSYFPNSNIKSDVNITKKYVDNFINGDIDHLIICGDVNSGKTKFAVAIGTELGFSMVPVRYVEMVDFIDLVDDVTEEEVHLAYILWKWQDAEVIIIDDVYLGQIKELCKKPHAIESMSHKKIIWVVNDTYALTELVVNIDEAFGSVSVVKTIMLQNKA